MTRTNWLFANPGDPYILTEMKPAAPLISCPGIVCANSPGNIFTATGTATTYSWTVGNGTIITGQGTDSLNVLWSGTQGWVYVYGNSLSGCPSLMDSCFVTVDKRHGEFGDFAYVISRAYEPVGAEGICTFMYKRCPTANTLVAC